MSALLDAPVVPTPAKPRRRADRGANAQPRVNAPSAQRPRDAAWVHVPASSACEHVAPVVPLRHAALPADALSVAVQPTVALPARAHAADASPSAPRYAWTSRGIAAMLIVVAAACAIMLGTLVNAYLAVSNAPFDTPAAPSAAASQQASAQGDGRAS